ncbi:MAG: cytochrome C oxidase subunit IV family protein [Verrucomicrobiae bacterium]|nr:cytochrome C oxidase subunit IV family protein [Verrucomicrobiae bacterium]
MNHLVTYFVLLALTATSILLAERFPQLDMLPLAIMGLATAKFLLVAFRFMEMRRGHLAWKVGLIGFSTLFLVFLSIASP